MIFNFSETSAFGPVHVQEIEVIKCHYNLTGNTTHQPLLSPVELDHFKRQIILKGLFGILGFFQKMKEQIRF